MAATETVQEIAGEAFDWFEQAKRAGEDEETFTRLKDGAPEWIRAAVYAAHGEMLPDDYRYEWTQDAFGAIHDADAGDDLDDVGAEFADSVDVYTAGLLKWVGSNLHRVGYVDDATSDHDCAGNLARALMIGQAHERREVFEAALRAVEERAAG